MPGSSPGIGSSPETYPETLAQHEVACVRAGQGDTTAPEQARRLLRMAHDHLAQGRVVLTLVGGLPGTGKSTLATGLADRLGWSVLRSDELRKDLAGIGHTTRAGGAFGEGLEDERSTAATYRALLDHARSLLELGEPVILDASWTDRHWRDLARAVAHETSSDLRELRCDVPVEIARERQAVRASTGTDASDAISDIAARMATRADPWSEATTIDTSVSRAVAATAALAAVR